METTLLTVGLACLVGAIAGGGMNLLGIQIPVLSMRRQVLLGLIGLLLTAGSQLERLGLVGRTAAGGGSIADAGARPVPSAVPPVSQPQSAQAPSAPGPSGGVAATPGPAPAIVEPPAPPADDNALVFAVQGDGSWIEVRPREGGPPLVSRLVRAGETVGLQLGGPVRIVVGDPGAVTVTLRGKPVTLAPVPGKSLARISLE